MDTIIARHWPQTRIRRRTLSEQHRDDRVNVGDWERLASGVAGGILAAYGLSQPTPARLALSAVGGALMYRGLTGHCYCYEALGIETADHPHGPLASVRAGSGVKVEKSLTINRPPDELYWFWRRLENLPHFMSHLESVQNTGPLITHWVGKGPLGMRVEWDAEIHNEEINRMIAWRSIEGSEVDTAGSVHFEPAPGNRGTVVRVVLKYDPPAGKAGALIARLFGEAPEQQIQEDLRRFKQIMEAGEFPTTPEETSCREPA